MYESRYSNPTTASWQSILSALNASVKNDGTISEALFEQQCNPPLIRYTTPVAKGFAAAAAAVSKETPVVGAGGPTAKMLSLEWTDHALLLSFKKIAEVRQWLKDNYAKQGAFEQYYLTPYKITLKRFMTTAAGQDIWSDILAKKVGKSK